MKRIGLFKSGPVLWSASAPSMMFFLDTNLCKDEGNMNSTDVTPSGSFAREIEADHVEHVSRCFHCRKCTNGCPLVTEMDLMPNQVIRMVQLGMRDQLLRSKTIWVCATCETCTTRCPNDIDIAGVMDAMRHIALREKVPAAIEQVPMFHKSFLNSIKMFGRVFELGMTGEYMLRSKDFFSNTEIGMGMFKRGKLHFLPHKIKGSKQVKEIFRKAKGGR